MYDNFCDASAWLWSVVGTRKPLISSDFRIESFLKHLNGILFSSLHTSLNPVTDQHNNDLLFYTVRSHFLLMLHCVKSFEFQGSNSTFWSSI